jgi:hypothetical protein
MLWPFDLDKSPQFKVSLKLRAVCGVGLLGGNDPTARQCGATPSPAEPETSSLVFATGCFRPKNTHLLKSRATGYIAVWKQTA